jgi:hypothetical protein
MCRNFLIIGFIVLISFNCSRSSIETFIDEDFLSSHQTKNKLKEDPDAIDAYLSFDDIVVRKE